MEFNLRLLLKYVCVLLRGLIKIRDDKCSTLMISALIICSNKQESQSSEFWNLTVKPIFFFYYFLETGLGFYVY